MVDSVNRTTELLTIPDNWPTASPRHGDSIDLDYLHPLVVSMIGDHECEDLISQISDGQQTVATLDMQIRTWVSEGFSLDHDNTLLGKFHAPNYTSALEQFRSQTTKSLIKRLQTHKTVGPFSWSGTVDDLPFLNCAVNPIGAVAYKYEPDRARACDDPFINAAIQPTHFKMPALQQLRDAAYPCCSWSKSDVASAFTCMNMAQHDLPHMMFAWYHPDDTEFKGSDQDCLYVHTHGNFGPRPLPYMFTMLMTYVNIAAKAKGLPIPASFIDDNIHTGDMSDLTAMVPDYYHHLACAGLKDKLTKRELLLYEADLLGRWFDSVTMTLSIPQDKIDRLTAMLTDARMKPSLSYHSISTLLGYWEFCSDLLPTFMKAFAFAACQFKNTLRFLNNRTRRWCPKSVRRDLACIETLLPTVNNTVPLQPLSGRRKSMPVYTDACGGKKAAGAYVTPDGVKWWPYKGKQKKANIAWLEGFCLEQYLIDEGHSIRGTKLPWFCDNTSFLGCIRKCRSRNKYLNSLVHRILLLCYTQDIYLLPCYVSTHDNTLADAASRQRWDIFNKHWPAYHGFADSRASRLQRLQEAEEGVEKILPSRVRFSVQKYQQAAYEQTTRVNARSAWKWWCEYAEECEMPTPFMDPESDEFPIYLAGFEAAVADNLYGSNVKASSSVDTYSNQVTWLLKEHRGANLRRAVSRGIHKQLQSGKRYQGSMDITFFASLYQLHSASNDIRQVRNLLAFSFLGFGLQRSQSVSVNSSCKSSALNASMFDHSSAYLQNKTLLLEDTRLDRTAYAIWWGLKFSKGDPFNKRLGKDGRDWTPTAGCQNADHPIDIVSLYIHYCHLMSFPLQREGREYDRCCKLPFFQEIDARGRPTGKPMTYAHLLKALKDTITEFFPDMDATEFGTHSFRRFGATLAKCNGVPDDLIQLMGRWVSQCFQSYFQFSDEDKVQANAALLP